MNIWRRLSLRARLNVLSASLLAMALAINVGSLVAGAGARIDAEIVSSMRLAADFVESALANLRDGSDTGADAALDRLVASLQNFRHVRIVRERDGQARATPPEEGARSRDVPAWFAALVHPAARTMRLDARVDGRDFGRIVIASFPYDEMIEVWDGARTLTLVGLTLVFATFALTFWIVDRSLVPIRAISRGLGQLAAGRYEERLVPSGPPEFIDIGAKLNALSATLSAAEAENRYLVGKLISVQDDDRKELARELHDEFGAHLFGIRANMTSLVSSTGALTHDPERFAATSRSVIELVDALQRLNRRILGRLRPMALGEFGLSEAVRGLAVMWATSSPEVHVNLELAAPPDALDEATALTAYRVIQESLTNVFRHSGATRVQVETELVGDPAGARTLRLRVRDDGRGMAPEARPGLGLLGMRERVRSLGGDLRTVGSGGGGFTVEADVPLWRRAAAAE